MNELIAFLYLAGFALGGFFAGCWLHAAMTKDKIAAAKHTGWTDCEIHLRDRFHFHKKPKGRK